MELEIIKLGGLLGDHQAGAVYDTRGLSPTLLAGMSHGNMVPYIVVEDGKTNNKTRKLVRRG